MTSPLEGSIAKTIGKAFASTFYACTVTRMVPGGGPPHDPGDPTEVSYGCKGIEDQFTAYERQNTLIQAQDVKVIILATSLSIAPVAGDRVTIRNKTLNIIDAVADPAMATWTCQCRA